MKINNIPVNNLKIAEGSTATLWAGIIIDSFGNDMTTQSLPLRVNKQTCINDMYKLYVDIWKKLRFDNDLRRGQHGHYVDASGYQMLSEPKFEEAVLANGAYIHLLHKRIAFRIHSFELKVDTTFTSSLKI